VTIVSEFAVVEISFEDDEIGIGEVKEEIGSCVRRKRRESAWIISRSRNLSLPSLLSSQN